MNRKNSLGKRAISYAAAGCCLLSGTFGNAAFSAVNGVYAQEEEKNGTASDFFEENLSETISDDGFEAMSHVEQEYPSEAEPLPGVQENVEGFSQHNTEGASVEDQVTESWIEIGYDPEDMIRESQEELSLSEEMIEETSTEAVTAAYQSERWITGMYQDILISVSGDNMHGLTSDTELVIWPVENLQNVIPMLLGEAYARRDRINNPEEIDLQERLLQLSDTMADWLVQWEAMSFSFSNGTELSAEQTYEICVDVPECFLTESGHVLDLAVFRDGNMSILEEGICGYEQSREAGMITFRYEGSMEPVFLLIETDFSAKTEEDEMTLPESESMILESPEQTTQETRGSPVGESDIADDHLIISLEGNVQVEILQVEPTGQENAFLEVNLDEHGATRNMKKA